MDKGIIFKNGNRQLGYAVGLIYRFFKLSSLFLIVGENFLFIGRSGYKLSCLCIYISLILVEQILFSKFDIYKQVS